MSNELLEQLLSLLPGSAGNRAMKVELLGNNLKCMFSSFLLDAVLHTKSLVSV